MEELKDMTPYVVVAKFADVEIPCFKELKNKNYIQYGDDNMYPQYLTKLFNKSAKHNAILVGKSKYIFGEGFANGDFTINRLGESLNDLSLKNILDEVVYGGFYLEVIWNRLGKIQEIYHADYNKIRKDKDGGYLFCEDWKKWTKEEDQKHIDEFDPRNPVGSQIYFYKSYRPGQEYYPLPDYVGAINYVEVDIEIGKFNLSGIKNGMNPSKMIQFFKGEPSEDKKREIEARMAKKFAGAENAGKFILVFNEGADAKAVQIDDMSANDLDKMYDQLNKTCQQEIFSGHGVTSGMLFGIENEGKLGGATELNLSYAIFQNTYSKPKADIYSKEITWLMSFSAYNFEYELLPTDPIGVQFDVKDVINSLPKKFVFEKLGIPEDQWGLENIGVDNKPTPTTPIAPSTDTGGMETDLAVNENLKHLNAKQLQNILRVRKRYMKGEIDADMARVLIGGGYGLSDDDVNIFLGIQPPLKFSSNDSEEDGIITVMDQYGESNEDYEIIKSKPVNFSSELQAESDEAVYIKEAFVTYDVTTTEGKILDLIQKDKLITPEVISATINQTVAYVKSRIESLTQRGYIQVSEAASGVDTLVERIISPDLNVPPVKINDTPLARISIMYSYEGPQDSKNRPFCARMLELRRLYTRADIENISQRLGYSVFDRRGGFWTRKGTNKTTPYCRHHWRSSIVIKKEVKK